MRNAYRIIGAPGAVVPGWFPLVADRLSRLAGPRVPTQADIFGSRMLLDPSDYTQRKILYRSFEPREVRAVRRLLRPGDTAVDVGANVGFFTLVMARAVGSTGRVVAFEPIPANRETLLRNVGLNGYENVEVRPAAVGEAAGIVNLMLPGADAAEGTQTSGAWRRASANGGVKVPQVALDDEFGDSRLRLVKIDVEGMEPSALAGMQRMLGEHRVDTVLVEIAHAPRHEVVDPLRRAGYRLRTVDIFARAAGVYNILATSPIV
jgi:FkbM family methyltransferase